MCYIKQIRTYHIMAPIHSIPSLEGGIPLTAFLLNISSLLIKRFSFASGGLGLGGVIDIWPVRPYETVIGIKGYTD